MKETVLITGASGGLGKEFAYLFAADGCDLVLIARTEEALKDLQKELKKMHKIFVTVLAKDLSKPNAAEEIFNQLQKKKLRVTWQVESPNAEIILPLSLAGIVVVSFDGIVTEPCAWRIAVDFAKMGEVQVDYLAKKMPDGGNLLEIRGLAGVFVWFGAGCRLLLS